MKKIIVPFLLCLFSFSANARQLLCQQNPRDVAVQVRQVGDELVVKVLSPMGYDYFPMIEGPLRRALRSWADYQFEQLKVLGSEFEVRFPKSNCQYGKKNEFKVTPLECVQGKLKSQDGIRFHTFSIIGMNEVAVSQVVSSQKFRFSVSVPGQWGEDTFFISFTIPDRACQERE